MDGRESIWHQAGRTVGSFEPRVRHRLGLSREEFSTSCGAGPQSPCNSVGGGETLYRLGPGRDPMGAQDWAHRCCRCLF